MKLFLSLILLFSSHAYANTLNDVVITMPEYWNVDLVLNYQSTDDSSKDDCYEVSEENGELVPLVIQAKAKKERELFLSKTYHYFGSNLSSKLSEEQKNCSFELTDITMIITVSGSKNPVAGTRAEYMLSLNKDSNHTGRVQKVQCKFDPDFECNTDVLEFSPEGKAYIYIDELLPK